MRTAVALSGGIDSAVAAHILTQAGHDVFGLTMTLDASAHGNAAASLAAASLGIEHHTVDASDRFHRDVVRPFLAEYAAGRTPNPCVICNEVVKFGLLMDEARRLGAGRLATGHHSRIETRPDGRPLLRMGSDRLKDQSYFLYRLSAPQLAASVMPIGDLTKAEVRSIAGECGFTKFAGRESADICFAAGGLSGFVRAEAADLLRPGPIEDADGKILGTHEGIALYTIGQRSGLGVALGTPVYVTRIDVSRNAVIVGPNSALMFRALTARNLAWPSGETPSGSFGARAKVRYAARPAACHVTIDGGRAHVRFEKEQRAIAPGQSVVFYDGEIVLGGGTIEAAGGPAA